jgi:ferric enterobactin receptor
VTRSIFIVLFIVINITLRAQQPVEEVHVQEIFRKTLLSKALKTIQDKYSLKIAYDPSLVQNIIVDLRLNDLGILQSLERLTEGTPVKAQQVGNNFIIVPRPKVSDESIPGKTNISLSGKVIDHSTEETLPQATIWVHGTNITTTTNNDGHFTLFAIPHDTCTLEVRYLGYITQAVRIKDLDTSREFSIHLKSDTQILNEVVVLDEYNQAVHTEDIPGAFVFNPKALHTLPSLGEQDMSRTMQLLPGVTATDESSSGMIIRGSHASYNLTLLDGMTIYQQDHFFGSFSIINADIIKDVRVHKGMFDPRYGGRVSGVIDITTKNGNSVKPAFNAKLNMINGKATVEIPIAKKWSLFAGARRSFTDVVQSKLFDNLFAIARTYNDQIDIFRFVEPLGRQVTPQYYFFDTNTKLSFRPSSRDILSLSLYISRDRMDIRDSTSLGSDNDTFIVDSDEVTRWGNNGASLRWARQWSDTYYTNIRISDSKFFRKYNYQHEIVLDSGQSTYAFNFKNSINDLSYTVDNEWKPRNTLSVDWGLSGTRQETDVHIQDRYTSDIVSPDEIPEDTNITENEYSWLHSLYGGITVSPASRLTTSAGARMVYYYNQRGQVYFEPRLTASYKLTGQLNLKTGYGRSHQFITQLFYPSRTGSISGINENFWILSRPGDVSAPVISSDHVSAGATLRSKQFAYDAEVYYKTSEGVIIDENLNSGNTTIYGLDIMVQKTSGIHKGWIAYSLAHATQTHPYILQGARAPSWQDQRHELKVIDMLMLRNWNLSSTLIFGSGKPYPKYTVRYHRNEDGVINDYDLLLDYSNQSRLPVYFRIDFAASYSIRLKNSREIEMGLSIHNITDHKNIKTRKIDTTRLDEAKLTNTEVPATYMDIVLLGFAPTLSVNVSL